MKKLLTAAVAALMLVSPAMAQSVERFIRVENHSGLGSPIVGIVIMNEHGRSTELLNGRTISPGYNRTLEFDDREGHNHCIYTIGAVFANGTKAIRPNVNVCVAYSWKIYDLDNTLD